MIYWWIWGWTMINWVRFVHEPLSFGWSLCFCSVSFWLFLFGGYKEVLRSTPQYNGQFVCCATGPFALLTAHKVGPDFIMRNIWIFTNFMNIVQHSSIMLYRYNVCNCLHMWHIDLDVWGPDQQQQQCIGSRIWRFPTRGTPKWMVYN